MKPYVLQADRTIAPVATNKVKVFDTYADYEASDAYGTDEIVVVKEATAETVESKGTPVGAVMGFAAGVPNDNWLECDGSTFDQYKYPALYTYLGTNVLPDYRNRFLEGVGPNETVGTNKAAGLPNITAWTSPLHYNPSGATASGAMTIGGQLDYWTKGSASGGDSFTSVRQLNFDASRSSAVYGNSTTVQPASTLIRWCIKATSAGIDVDTSLYATKGEVDLLADYGPDYAHGVTTTLSTQSGDTSTGQLITKYTAEDDCYLIARHWVTNGGAVSIATTMDIWWGDQTASSPSYDTSISLSKFAGYGSASVCGPIRLFPGDTITMSFSGYNSTGYSKNYTVYPVRRGE